MDTSEKTATLSEWLEDWREVANFALNCGWRGVTVITTIGDVDYRLFRVRAYSREDSERRHVRTPARDMEDKTARMTRQSIDLMFSRLITVRSRPIYVLEPLPGNYEAIAVENSVTTETLRMSREELIMQWEKKVL